jgi:hypothetical protein
MSHIKRPGGISTKQKKNSQAKFSPFFSNGLHPTFETLPRIEKKNVENKKKKVLVPG